MWCPVLLFGEIALEADAAADDISRWTATLKRRSACKLGKIKLVTVQLNLIVPEGRIRYSTTVQ